MSIIRDEAIPNTILGLPGITDSLHIAAKETRKTSGSNKRMKENDNYHDKHLPKKSRYETGDTEDGGKYKKSSYGGTEKHADGRYYEAEKKGGGRARSRSKEHYQKKADGYAGRSRAARDYEGRDRADYASYAGNGARYRGGGVEGAGYLDDKHKYRQTTATTAYGSLGGGGSRVKGKRPMDR